MLDWHEHLPDLFENILWSDEAVFYVGGFVNALSAITGEEMKQIQSIPLRECILDQKLLCGAE